MRNWLMDGQGPALERRTDASPKCPTSQNTVARRCHRRLDKRNAATTTLSGRTDHAIAVQVLMETGLDRLQRAARSRHGSQKHSRGNCRYCQCPTPYTDRRLPPSRPPHTRSPSAPRQSAPSDRQLAKLTGHIVRAPVLSAQTAVPPLRKEKSGCRPQSGWSIRMPSITVGGGGAGDRSRHRRSGLDGNWSRTIATRRSFPTRRQKHSRGNCRYCRCTHTVY